MESGSTAVKTFQWSQLYADYQPKIMVFLQNCGVFSREDREDLLQVIMEKLTVNEKVYKKRYALSTWIYSIARNTAIDFLRKKKTEQSLPESDILEADQRFSPDYTFFRNEQMVQVSRFLSRLEPCLRQLAFLRFYENLSVKKCAEILDVPAGTVKYRLWTLRKLLREEVDCHD